MYNLLKKQYNIIIKLSLITTLTIAFSEYVNAQRGSNAKRNASSKSSKIKRNRNQNSTTKTRTSNIENTSKEAIPDTSNITKYNCETLYNKCMNQTCYKESNGRCDCNNTSVFNQADEKCKYIYNACPNLADNIISMYKRNAKSDCSSFAISDIKNTNVSITNILSNLISCMKPKCKSKSNEFVGCFDEDNFEKKFEVCKSTYTGVSDIALLKSMFKNNLNEYKKKYCDEIYGTIKSDGECYLNIGIGASFKTISKIKEFKVGDHVSCSESDFGTKLSENKSQKIRHIKEIVLTGLDFVQKGLSIASKIASGKKEGHGKEAEKKYLTDENGNKTNQFMEVYKGSGELISTRDWNDNLEIGLEGFNALAGSQHLAGAIIGIDALNNQDFSYSGYCYVIKGDTVKELFPASDDYYYKLRWGENWTSSSFIKDEGGEQ
ncbi:MAG: hypothetical protein J6J27_02095 [Alphaproteobacteria bacterium]|nr:hypothetical protein [Alphaproteobacteria bacterium]